MARPAPALSLRAAVAHRKDRDAAERMRFLAATGRASAEAHAFGLALGQLGYRISEALAPTGGDVQPVVGLVATRTLKRRGQLLVREVPAAPELIALLRAGHDLGQPAALLWPWAA